MTTARSIAVALALSFVAAGIVGFVSRTPASIRSADPAPQAAGASFTDAQVRRHAAYRGPLYLALALGLVIQVALLVMLRGEPIGRVARLLEAMPGGWPVVAAEVGAFVALAGAVVALPLGFVRGYSIQKAWGLSTQTPMGWMTDQLKGAGVALVIAALAAVAFYAVVRWQPRAWWLWGAAAFTVLSALLTFLFPVVVAPLFNRFTPLADPPLEARIDAIADAAGIDIDEVLVADASRRSTAENAYVAGLGATKQLVLYDNLLRSGDDDATLFVVAHELGHRRERHIVKGIALSAVGLFAGFAVLAWLTARPGVLRWTGVTSIADPKGLPALVLYATLAGLVLMPFQNAVSRSHERTADRVALGLTDDPQPAADAFRRLALANIADLRPHPITVALLYSHPPIAERIATALNERDR